MQMVTPKFLNGNTTFHQDLKARVQQYFSEIKKPSTGDISLIIKAIFFCIGYVSLYIHLVFFTPAWYFAIPECLLMAMFTAAIGFNVMHDGNHGSFSEYKTVNKIAGFSLNFLGASAIMWHMKHNIIHHTYTNIEGVDDDIEAGPLLRFTEGRKRLKIHRFQHIYFWFLYSLLHIMWIFFTDFKKYFTKKIGNVPIKKMSTREHISFWTAKVLYLFMVVALPIYLLGFLKWLTGFLIISMTTGFIISIVFQLAHTVEHTEFPLPEQPSNKIENEWAIHQVATTANFATNNKLISWLVGGLNFQIEHHLFPKISHIHYPAISKIIKQVCQEHGIKYNEFGKMREAIISHYYYLRRMGQPA
ncbi:MAG TPA: acyl-CoA desaturase [Chitinophagaceae bacterium]|nr:acyl-CoA desaturase [Chitinophagaceae bacterium]